MHSCEAQARIADEPARIRGLGTAACGQGIVEPAAEHVARIGRTLAVAQQQQNPRAGWVCWLRRTQRIISPRSSAAIWSNLSWWRPPLNCVLRQPGQRVVRAPRARTLAPITRAC